MIELNELKTLKEIDGWHFESLDDGKPYTFEKTHGTSFYRLKQEAIKWIKAVDKHEEGMDQCNHGEDCLLCKLTDYNEQDLMKWIKYFFNITEEDLK